MLAEYVATDRLLDALGKLHMQEMEQILKKPRVVNHFPDGTIRVYDILGDEIHEYYGKQFEEVKDRIEITKGRLGVVHTHVHPETDE